MSIPIKPLAEYVVATREEAATKTASGLYLPANAKEKPAYAVVQAVGPEVKSLKIGDKIVFKEYKQLEMKVGTTEYLIIEEEDVLATLV